jgi:hypothetical protein
MNNNQDVQTVRDGIITDARMEQLMRCLYEGSWDGPDFDDLAHDVFKEFLRADIPKFHLTTTLKSVDGLATGYLSLLGLAFSVVYPSSPLWPGVFPWFPDAQVAVTIYYPGSKESTGWAPGMGVNQAIIGALFQLSREISETEYNQGNFLTKLN